MRRDDPFNGANADPPGLGHLNRRVAALFQHAAKLPRVDIVKPKAVIAMGFGDDPIMGMSCDSFTGSATARLITRNNFRAGSCSAAPSRAPSCTNRPC